MRTIQEESNCCTTKIAKAINLFVKTEIAGLLGKSDVGYFDAAGRPLRDRNITSKFNGFRWDYMISKENGQIEAFAIRSTLCNF